MIIYKLSFHATDSLYLMNLDTKCVFHDASVFLPRVVTYLPKKGSTNPLVQHVDSVVIYLKKAQPQPTLPFSSISRLLTE